MVQWDTLLVLNFRRNIVDGIRGLDLRSNCLASESLDEDLHTTAETGNIVKSELL
jgi:hypothetical protein